MNDSTPELDQLAHAPLDARDVEALRLLRSVYEGSDPVPEGLVERVKFAITLDDLEAEVARLQRDSVPDGMPELVSRSDGLLKARTVTFTSDTVTTMVTITPIDARTVRLDGWAAPGAHLDIELRVGDTSRHVIADEDGRFVFESVEHGLAQLVLRPAEEGDGGHPVITPAIEL
ncbi:MAG: carboxypeptidase regulatory-like domain-containing protein [Lapillicoccus sp.]